MARFTPGPIWPPRLRHGTEELAKNCTAFCVNAYLCSKDAVCVATSPRQGLEPCSSRNRHLRRQHDIRKSYLSQVGTLIRQGISNPKTQYVIYAFGWGEGQLALLYTLSSACRFTALMAIAPCEMTLWKESLSMSTFTLHPATVSTKLISPNG